jgi:hypothetical protein
MAAAFVQKAYNSTVSAVTSQAVAYGSNNLAGNTLVLFARFDAATTPSPSITDTAGNTWVLGSTFTTFSPEVLTIWYVQSCKAGANTVTVHYGATLVAGTPASSVYVAEYSGLGPFDLAVGNATIIGTSPATVNFTPAGSGETAIASEFGSAASSGTNYTQRSIDLDAGGLSHDLFEDRFSCPAGAQSATVNTGSTTFWFIGVAIFALPVGSDVVRRSADYRTYLRM